MKDEGDLGGTVRAIEGRGRQGGEGSVVCRTLITVRTRATTQPLEGTVRVPVRIVSGRRGG